jgi:hypothetical protein
MHTIFTPSWFYAYDLVFHLIFALTSLLLAAVSTKLYNLTGQRQAKLFGIGFFLISASYFTKLLFDSIIFWQWDKTSLQSILTIEYWSTYLHYSLALSGLLVLLYMTFQIKNLKILAAMIGMSIVAQAFCEEPFLCFYLISVICFALISLFFLQNYSRNRCSLAFFSAMAFVLLLVSSILFVLPADNDLLYVVGHVFELTAYILILANFCLLFKRRTGIRKRK